MSRRRGEEGGRRREAGVSAHDEEQGAREREREGRRGVLVWGGERGKE